MTERGNEEDGDFYEPLARHRLGRAGVEAKLDKGFEPGTYCIYVEYDALADKVGFVGARRQARDYSRRLRGQLSQLGGYGIGEVDDPSVNSAPGRKHDLETTFLHVTITSDDGRWHDEAMREKFRVAVLRADQEWDQVQAGAQERRLDARRERFRERFKALLSGEGYQNLDRATKVRLLADVPALAFPKERSR
jgi:hypothetical protein